MRHTPHHITQYNVIIAHLVATNLMLSSAKMDLIGWSKLSMLGEDPTLPCVRMHLWWQGSPTISMSSSSKTSCRTEHAQWPGCSSFCIKKSDHTIKCHLSFSCISLRLQGLTLHIVRIIKNKCKAFSAPWLGRLRPADQWCQLQWKLSPFEWEACTVLHINGAPQVYSNGGQNPWSVSQWHAHSVLSVQSVTCPDLLGCMGFTWTVCLWLGSRHHFLLSTSGCQTSGSPLPAKKIQQQQISNGSGSQSSAPAPHIQVTYLVACPYWHSNYLISNKKRKRLWNSTRHAKSYVLHLLFPLLESCVWQDTANFQKQVTQGQIKHCHYWCAHHCTVPNIKTSGTVTYTTKIRNSPQHTIQ